MARSTTDAVVVGAGIAGLTCDPADADGAIEARARSRLRRWFGTQVDERRHLRTHRIVS